MYPQKVTPLTDNSLYSKKVEEFYKQRNENKLSIDYQWQINDLTERLNKVDFLLNKAFDLIEELQKVSLFKVE